MPRLCVKDWGAPIFCYVYLCIPLSARPPSPVLPPQCVAICAPGTPAQSPAAGPGSLWLRAAQPALRRPQALGPGTAHHWCHCWHWHCDWQWTTGTHSLIGHSATLPLAVRQCRSGKWQWHTQAASAVLVAHWHSLASGYGSQAGCAPIIFFIFFFIISFTAAVTLIPSTATAKRRASPGSLAVPAGATAVEETI